MAMLNRVSSSVPALLVCRPLFSVREEAMFADIGPIHRVHKKEATVFGYNFDKFGHNFIMFCTNHPGTSMN